MALDEMGVDFEHWKISEWETNANRSYKACHIADNKDYTVDMSRREVIDRLYKLGISNDGKLPMTLKQIGRKPEKWQRKTLNEFIQCHNLGSITKVHGKDFAICDTDKYTYMFTYSFPCTDLSVAGKMLGMSEGSGTRSGLLWEVKRILTEIHESGGELPQILFMENVPQVLSSANVKDFHAWQDFLTSLGYTNHVQILNAKDYGVAQNRERAFMFSFLGEFNYKFPEPIPLTKTIKDYLEDEVPEKYYINTEKAQKLIEKLIESGDLQGCVGNINPSGNGLNGNVYAGDMAPTLTTNKGEGQKIIEVNQIGNIAEENHFDNPQTGRIYNVYGISPTLNTCGGGGHEPKIIVAMRGRNPENSSDRTPGIQTEQRLEPNSQGICNTLTSVQKDNMVLEAQVLTPKRTEYGKSIRKAYESGEVKESRHNMTEMVPRNDGIANTLTTVEKDNLLLVLLEIYYRIRKLTPRECGRLMGVSDEDISKMEQVNSNSQLYKQFGNSIVVDVMVEMFRNLNIDNHGLHS